MRQPFALMQSVSAVQQSGTTGPLVHAPLTQVSGAVQGIPSLHDVPSAAAGFSEHTPVAGSQVAAAGHSTDAAQVTGPLPPHAPAWQVSVCVQPLPSLQAVPSAAAGFEHVPVAGSQVPAT